MVLRCLTSGHKLLLCSNGGSASDATHLATEFLCRCKEACRAYPAILLTANGEFMTAVCNDYHADEIFARHVYGANCGRISLGNAQAVVSNRIRCPQRRCRPRR